MAKKPKKLNYPLAMDDVPHKVRFRFFQACGSWVNNSTLNGCLIWRLCKDPKGYGQFRIARKTHWAHRIAYVLFVGPIPPGMTVHHKCGCTSCVNPQHLELVTVEDNTREGNSRRSYLPTCACCDADKDLPPEIPF